jgi:HEAT repeat protein
MRSRSVFLLVVLALCACRAQEKPPDVAQLVAQLSDADPKKSGDARLALILLGEAAAPAVAERLRTGQPAERLAAATTLWGMGARARVAVPDLAVAVRDPDVSLRVTAAMALESMGPAAAPAVPALIEALRDREGPVRQAAVKALGAIGKDARDAVPVLKRVLRQGPWPEAAEALGRIQGTTPATAPDAATPETAAK